jgi:hypothetical protein
MYDSSELKESGVRSRLAIQNAKSNASKNEEKIPDFYTMTDSTTKQALKTIYEGKEYTSFAIEKAIKFIAGKDEVEVSEFYINEDNEVIFSGRKKVKSTLKTITETKKDESKKTVEKDGKDRWTKVNNNRLNQIEANLLAVNLGYSNTGELVKAARKKVSGLTSRRTEVNRSEIPSLAAKYGHKSVEEYTRLLIEKGIKIID